MNKRIRIIFFLFTVSIAAILIFPNRFTSAASFTKAMVNEENNIYIINDKRVLIKTGQQIEIMDLTQGKIIKKMSINGKILNIQSLTGLNKIIVLTRSEANKLQKYVFNDHGEKINYIQYKLNLAKNVKVKWVAPVNGSSESFLVEQGGVFTLYPGTGTKSLWKFDAKIKNSSYEYVNVEDWDFIAPPYLVVKYNGQRTMATDYFIKIINLSTQKTIELPNLNIDSSFKLTGGSSLRLWNSYTYSDIIPANVVQPDSTKAQSIFATYRADTAQEIFSIKQKFSQVDGQSSGWETQVVGDHIFVQDLNSLSWSLYDTKGTELATQQEKFHTTPKFIGYNSANHTAYFLVNEQGTDATILKALKID